MQMINETQQQQQLIAQAWKEELVKEQWSLKERRSCASDAGQIEHRQGEEEQHLVRKQVEMKEDIAGLKDWINLAQSKEEQQFLI